MRSVFSFAAMTMKSLLRRRTIYGIAILLLLALVGIGQVPSFDVANQGRFVLDFGLFGIELGGLLLAIGLASNLYPRDREQRTVMPLVAVPLSRTRYLLGRFTGAALVQAAVMVAGLLGLMVILLLNGLHVPSNLPSAGLLLVIEGWFLLSVVFFFSFWTSPPLNAPLTIIIFILSQMSVRDFVGLLPSASGVMRVIRMILPHMDVFHIKDPVAHGIPVEPVYFALAAFYGLAYSAFMLSLAMAVWRRRDLK
jgi:ABC-type transport system involved in multi-copper enzyme maturation permease subunit